MKNYLIIFICLFVFFSCSKKESDVTYISNDAELKAYSGNERIKLVFAAEDDVQYWEIHWKGKGFQKRVDKSEVVDGVITTFVENIEAGSQVFEITAYLESGDASVYARVRVEVYDQTYETTLQNRVVISQSFIGEEDPYIIWGEAQTGEVALDIDYTTQEGTVRRVRLEKDSTLAILADYKPNTTISYQSRYLPEPNCIDTFSAASQSMPAITYYANLTVKSIVEKSGLVSQVITQSSLALHLDVEYTTLKFENNVGNPFSLFIVKADLSKNQVSTVTLMPNNSTQFGVQTVQDMAKHRDAGGDKIIAATNADFFSYTPVAGTPWGPVVLNGAILKDTITTTVPSTNYFGVKKDGTLDIGIASDLSDADYSSFQNLVGGGNAVLYLNGVRRLYGDAVREPRTIIGYTTDKLLYLIVVDGRRTGHSAGMTIDELGATIGSLGVYAGMNFDGGGSSTMVLKNSAGSFDIVNRYTDPTPRVVANAIGIKIN